MDFIPFLSTVAQSCPNSFRFDNMVWIRVKKEIASYRRKFFLKENKSFITADIGLGRNAGHSEASHRWYRLVSQNAKYNVCMRWTSDPKICKEFRIRLRETYPVVSCLCLWWSLGVPGNRWVQILRPCKKNENRSYAWTFEREEEWWRVSEHFSGAKWCWNGEL